MKNKILDLLKNTCCRLKPSKIEGVGVFAIRDIKKGVDPFYGTENQKWFKFSKPELKKLDKEVLKMIDDFLTIEENDIIYVPKKGLNGMDISFFLNNSKNSNLKIVGDGKDWALSFITARKIEKGEELTVSYATFDKKYKKLNSKIK